MSTQNPLRHDLEVAIAKVREQIDVQERSTHYIGDGPIASEAVAELRAELAELEDALAGLKER